MLSTFSNEKACSLAYSEVVVLNDSITDDAVFRKALSLPVNIFPKVVSAYAAPNPRVVYK